LPHRFGRDFRLALRFGCLCDYPQIFHIRVPFRLRLGVSILSVVPATPTPRRDKEFHYLTDKRKILKHLRAIINIEDWAWEMNLPMGFGGIWAEGRKVLTDLVITI
jgi:hypothetical protein